MERAQLAVFETVLVQHTAGLRSDGSFSVTHNHECQHTLLPDGIHLVALIRTIDEILRRRCNPKVGRFKTNVYRWGISPKPPLLLPATLPSGRRLQTLAQW